MRNSQKKIRTGLTAASALFATTFLTAQEKPLNIIYIMSDDHTGQMIGAYNGKEGYTPNIDKLATEGVTFTRVLWPTPFRDQAAPVCSQVNTAIKMAK
jgi:phosphoglycerol transferase MdoB-like AlkP superfamily enzyme